MSINPGLGSKDAVKVSDPFRSVEEVEWNHTETALMVVFVQDCVPFKSCE